MITREDVQHVAHLARLALTPAEEERFTEQLSQILGYVEQLQELDTTDVPPTYHAVDMDLYLRADEATLNPDREAILANAPDRVENFFKVPRLLES